MCFKCGESGHTVKTCPKGDIPTSEWIAFKSIKQVKGMTAAQVEVEETEATEEKSKAAKGTKSKSKSTGKKKSAFGGCQLHVNALDWQVPQVSIMCSQASHKAVTNSRF